jgi:site-specific DNA recombinase
VNRFFGYIRVSTAKQGLGVSLQEQKDAIERYCQRNRLEVIAWFEERETAAKRGRAVFNQMLKDLARGKADGVVIHKIDRSARNLKDWADLGELIDKGVDVHFANESLDLNSRGGRLSADIQAVVAADYIRNLREETRKGFYGRIKQGLYPLPAPLGYVDKGKAKPKEPDVVRAPLVKKAFELYGSGRYNLNDLAEELGRLGLSNRKGGKIARSTISDALHNPFYVGLIYLKRTGETFAGIHRPLISKSLFDRVQDVLAGKTNRRVTRHEFLFRHLLTCGSCGRSLTGEKQKGHAYYRCHTRECTKTCIREEAVEEAILEKFSPLQLTSQEKAYLEPKIAGLRENWVNEQQDQLKTLELQMSKVQERLDRLTDAYIDRLIEKDVFEKRKASLLMRQRDFDEKLIELRSGDQSLPDRVVELFELATSAKNLYELAFDAEKRDLVKKLSSNRRVTAKTIDITLVFPFSELPNNLKNANGGPLRGILRTFDELLSKAREYFIENPDP